MLRKTILAMVAVASVAMLSTGDASARAALVAADFRAVDSTAVAVVSTAAVGVEAAGVVVAGAAQATTGAVPPTAQSVWASASDLLVPMAAGDTRTTAMGIPAMQPIMMMAVAT